MSKLLSTAFYRTKVTNLVSNYRDYGVIRTSHLSNVEKSFHLFSKRNVLFIHIPKCAGVSLFKALYERDSFGHMTMNDYIGKYGESAMSNIYKFAIVRDPVSRLLSAYTYLKAGGRGRDLDKEYQSILENCHSVDDFVLKWLPRHGIQKFQHFIPQTDYIFNQDNQLQVDDVFKFEELDGLLPTLKKQCPALLSIQKESTLARTNKAPKPCAALDDDLVRIIKAHYSRDYELLKYS
jgi:hypothetical protein